jgi:hypothetical protein
MTSTPLEAHERINQAERLLLQLTDAARMAREAGFNGVAWRLGILAEEVVLMKHQINPTKRHGR